MLFLNDFYAFKAAYVLRDEFDLNAGNAQIRSFHNQSWYLAPTIIIELKPFLLEF